MFFILTTLFENKHTVVRTLYRTHLSNNNTCMGFLIICQIAYSLLVYLNIVYVGLRFVRRMTGDYNINNSCIFLAI